MKEKPKFLIIGAGLVGALMGHYLKQLNIDFRIFEKRPDPRINKLDAGRSINLALSHRGIHSLEKVGLKEKVMAIALPMVGRMVHEESGKSQLQKYSQSGEQIYSVSRAELNRILLDSLPDEQVLFEHELKSLKNKTAEFIGNDSIRLEGFDFVIGSDGANSVVKEFIPGNQFEVEMLGHGYQEFHVDAIDNEWAIENNALHIWPQHQHMLIALPNPDKSFTGTLFLQHEGHQASFSKLKTKRDYGDFFQKYYSSALKLIGDVEKQGQLHPIGVLGTGYNSCWADEDKLLIGDAAHSIVPFYGQGMNAGFEDCRLLSEFINNCRGDISLAFRQFFVSRKKDADAIAQMALQNFLEMRDGVTNSDYLRYREIEKVIQKHLGDTWVPRYGMVTFSDIPYAEVYQRSLMQDAILKELNARADSDQIISGGVLSREHLDLIQNK